MTIHFLPKTIERYKAQKNKTLAVQMFDLKAFKKRRFHTFFSFRSMMHLILESLCLWFFARFCDLNHSRTSLQKCKILYHLHITLEWYLLSIKHSGSCSSDFWNMTNSCNRSKVSSYKAYFIKVRFLSKINGGQTTTVVYVLTQALGQVDLTEIGSQKLAIFPGWPSPIFFPAQQNNVKTNSRPNLNIDVKRSLVNLPFFDGCILKYFTYSLSNKA